MWRRVECREYRRDFSIVALTWRRRLRAAPLLRRVAPRRAADRRRLCKVRCTNMQQFLHCRKIADRVFGNSAAASSASTGGLDALDADGSCEKLQKFASSRRFRFLQHSDCRPIECEQPPQTNSTRPRRNISTFFSQHWSRMTTATSVGNALGDYKCDDVLLRRLPPYIEAAQVRRVDEEKNLLTCAIFSGVLWPYATA